MKNNPLLTVIIPTYNVEKYIHACLDSVVNQTCKNLEIIIIDDASKDSTPQIIREYAEKDGRIKTFFHNKNKGPGKTRNEGLRLASGKYVTFMDHDDWQDLTKYEKMMNRAEKTNADIVFCEANEQTNIEYHGARIFSVSETHRTNRLFWTPRAFRGKISVDITNWQKKDIILGEPGPPWNKIVRREMISAHQIKFAEGSVKYDDILHHSLCIIRAEKVAFVEEMLYTHRLFPESISGKRLFEEPDLIFDFFDTWDLLENYCKKHGLNIKRIYASCLRLAYIHISNVKSHHLFFKKTKRIMLGIGLKKSEVPRHLLKYYYFFARPYWLNIVLLKVSYNTTSIRIRPLKKQFRVLIFGKKICEIGNFEEK